MSSIAFFSEDTNFSLEEKDEVTKWLLAISHQENQKIAELNYIFCSDTYLLKINKTYLAHDYFTDIITFDNRDEKTSAIEGDVFISIDRVIDNAKEHNVTFEEELNRVMAHGLLHLLGYNDKTEEEQNQMTEKEEASLSLRRI
ncbi:MAG: rRNA maturation RNase YbeY [Cyclobacteriaceae bacterium]|nr:rRNA maturation RNase YbeY [Cyclobacteriaceae bacterium HetDA_MAG_MS6]